MTYAEVQRMVIEQNGFRTWYGALKSPSSLSNEELQTVTTGVASYILAHPDDFAPASVAIAKGRVDFSKSPGYALADNSLAANAGVFVDEVGNQAASLNQSINPFSEQNRKYLLAVVLLAAALWYGPAVFKLWKARQKK